MTSPKSFSALVGKLKQQKASSENASMNLMKQRYDSEMAAERSKHQRELDSLQRQAAMSPGARSPTGVQPYSSGNSGYISPGGGALVPIGNFASPYRGGQPLDAYAPTSVRKSPTSGYKLAARPSATKASSSYGGGGGRSDNEPTGFMSPVTYNRKFNQLVSDMEQQTSLHVDDALREQRDRHADALERVRDWVTRAAKRASYHACFSRCLTTAFPRLAPRSFSRWWRRRSRRWRCGCRSSRARWNARTRPSLRRS
jgi:hypothetical protein